MVRFDFIIDKDNKVFMNEVNTIPGSMANYLFDEKYSNLIDRMILNGFVRYESRDNFIKSFDSSVLTSGMDFLKK